MCGSDKQYGVEWYKQYKYEYEFTDYFTNKDYSKAHVTGTVQYAMKPVCHVCHRAGTTEPRHAHASLYEYRHGDAPELGKS